MEYLRLPGFIPTRKDFQEVAFGRFIRVWPVYVIFMPLVTIIISTLRTVRRTLFFTTIPSGLVFSSFVTIAGFFLFIFLEAVISSNKAATHAKKIGQINLILTEEALIHISRYGETRIDWNIFTSFLDHKDLIILFPKNGTHTIRFIPKRIIPTSNAEAELLNLFSEKNIISEKEFNQQNKQVYMLLFFVEIIMIAFFLAIYYFQW